MRFTIAIFAQIRSMRSPNVRKLMWILDLKTYPPACKIFGAFWHYMSMMRSIDYTGLCLIRRIMWRKERSAFLVSSLAMGPERWNWRRH